MQKRYVYYCAFTVLGLLLATLLHAAIEIPALSLFTNNLEQYRDNWIWQNWQIVHAVGGFVLWVAGAAIGLWCGIRYWPRYAAQNQE